MKDKVAIIFRGDKDAINACHSVTQVLRKKGVRSKGPIIYRSDSGYVCLVEVQNQDYGIGDIILDRLEPYRGKIGKTLFIEIKMV